MWKKRAITFGLLCCFSLLSPCVGIASPTYTITAAEMEQLQNHLNALEANNEMLKSILTASDSELTVALEALMKSRDELTTLKAQLTQAKSDAESAKKSLQIANDELQKASQSFKEYEKARDKTENRLRNQRNIWEFIAALAVGVAVAR